MLMSHQLVPASATRVPVAKL